MIKQSIRSHFMNQKSRNFLRYLFVVALGVFLHFAYELSGTNPIVGLFALVNESIWEHLKLLFFPMLVLTAWDLFTRYRNNLNFLPARTTGILSGLAFIVVFYYTITGIIGSEITWISIAIYLLAVAYAFWLEKRLCAKRRYHSIIWAIVVLILFILLFIIFTIAPPPLGIFIPMAA